MNGMATEKVIHVKMRIRSVTHVNKNIMEFELLEDFAKWLTSEGWYFGELTELWYQDEEEISSKGKTFDEVIREFKAL